MVSLEADMTFAELESLKKFIGKGWEKWTIAKTTEIVTNWGYGWRRYYYGLDSGCSLPPNNQIFCSVENEGLYALDTPDLNNFSLGETGVLCNALTT